ncbi:prenyltransferase/squalene oxidase repeat-containing protein [Gracilibacillus timonensis]|uniref:hypothetical protein n=1 Tax=Gracilibacillus timonensis TaxID=1816696 RepID=UPI000A7722EB|nr:hypothetical protein [Gracilibacillus timonensis]
MKNWREEAGQRLDHLLKDVVPWVLQRYDPESGGFYFAQSAARKRSYPPDIESTAQAINILSRSKALDMLPRQALIRFFQERQQPDTGYFYDPHPLMKQDEVMVHRALNYAVNSLRRLGGSPLYPLPVQQRQAPSYAFSLEDYRAKWEQISLVNSWRGCDLLASSMVYVAEMDAEIQSIYVQAFADYLAEKQDKVTGLWGEGSMYVRISGTFKLHTFYRKYQIALPNQGKIYQSIWDCLHNEIAIDMCYIRNPIDLLSYLNVHVSEQTLEEVVKMTIDNMEQLKQADGAFSREIGHSVKAPNVAQVKADESYPGMPAPVELGLGLAEGDMNATTQATLIHQRLHQIWDKEGRLNQ